MTTLPASGYLSNANRTVGEQKQAFEDVRSVIAELLGGAAESTLTISSGSVTPTGGVHAIDTEAQAATDDLTNIDFTNMPDGRLLLIHAADSARTVNAKHQAGGTGEIKLADGVVFSLDDVDKWLLLKRSGTLAEEVLRSYGADRDTNLRFLKTFANDVRVVTSNTTVTSADRGTFFLIDATSGSVTMTLPTTEPEGFVVGFKRIDGSSNSITLDAGSGKLINTAQTLSIGTTHEAVWLVYDGGNWGILNDYFPNPIKQGKFTLTIPAAYINPRASNGCGPLATLETATNKANYRYLPFDPSAAEYAQFEVALPKMWDEGNVEVRALWSHPATTTNFGVVWEFAARARADNNAMDIAFGAAVDIIDTGGGTDTFYWTPWVAVTVAGATESSGQLFYIKRDATHGSDTLAVDARLHAVQIRFTANQPNDS